MTAESEYQDEPVNLYATIALVSALLGLFWIAIVYAFLSSRKQGGVGQAVAAVIIGFIELAAAVVITVVVILTFNDHSSAWGN